MANMYVIRGDHKNALDIVAATRARGYTHTCFLRVEINAHAAAHDYASLNAAYDVLVNERNILTAVVLNAYMKTNLHANRDVCARILDDAQRFRITLTAYQYRFMIMYLSKNKKWEMLKRVETYMEENNPELAQVAREQEGEGFLLPPLPSPAEKAASRTPHPVRPSFSTNKLHRFIKPTHSSSPPSSTSSPPPSEYPNNQDLGEGEMKQEPPPSSPSPSPSSPSPSPPSPSPSPSLPSPSPSSPSPSPSHQQPTQEKEDMQDHELQQHLHQLQLQIQRMQQLLQQKEQRNSTNSTNSTESTDSTDSRNPNSNNSPKSNTPLNEALSHLQITSELTRHLSLNYNQLLTDACARADLRQCGYLLYHMVLAGLRIDARTYAGLLSAALTHGDDALAAQVIAEMEANEISIIPPLSPLP